MPELLKVWLEIINRFLTNNMVKVDAGGVGGGGGGGGGGESFT